MLAIMTLFNLIKVVSVNDGSVNIPFGVVLCSSSADFLLSQAGHLLVALVQTSNPHQPKIWTRWIGLSVMSSLPAPDCQSATHRLFDGAAANLQSVFGYLLYLLASYSIYYSAFPFFA